MDLSLDQTDPPLDADALVDLILSRAPRPVAWARLDQDETAAAMLTLSAWVRWLVVRYGLDQRTVPRCWPAHGALLEELSALHTAHRACFDPAGAPTGPAEWHQIFAATRARLETWAARTGCRAGEHRDDVLPTWAAP